MTARQRYCYFKDPVEPRTILRSMGLALEVARPASTILLAVHAKRNLFDNYLVTEAFGRPALENLWKRKRLASKQAGFEVQLMTARIAPVDWTGDTALLLFPNQKLLDKVEAIEAVAHLIVVPEELPATDLKGWFDDFDPKMVQAPLEK
jgi:hypothetical protein